jgi:hypothetical protein
MQNGILQDQNIDKGSSNLREPTQPRAATDREQKETMEQSRKFTLFPKLPTEMRRMIWVMSFEGKDVGLDIYPLWEENHSDTDPKWAVQPRRVFPVSLWVSKESREETSRHYSIVSFGDVFDKYHGLPSICTNFGLDSFVISKILALNGVRPAKPNREDMCDKWLTHLDSAGNGGLQRVQHLEITQFHWGHSDGFLRIILDQYRHEVQKEEISPGQVGSPLVLPLLKVILRFTDLKVLCLTWLSTCPIMDTPDELWTLEDCRKNMQDFVDRHKDIYVGGKAPKVRVRYWNKEEGHYVYSAPETKGGEDE